MYGEQDNFEAMEGHTLLGVYGDGEYMVVFRTSGGCWMMQHRQDCCEGVYLHDVSGDPQDLAGAYITAARTATSDEHPEDVPSATVPYDSSFTWTYYNMSTPQGDLQLRWLGSSNGYYSESVDCYKVADDAYLGFDLLKETT